MYPTKKEADDRIKQITSQLKVLEIEENKLNRAKEKLLHEKYLLDLLEDFRDQYLRGDDNV